MRAPGQYRRRRPYIFFRVDGGLNPRLSGAGAKIAAKLGRADVAPSQSYSFRTINLMVANDGWVADPCQGRQPPKAGAEGPPLQGSAAQPQSTPED
ncbi:MAG: hypothetical protein QOH05_1072 [Acetobacteraceae bacterium]|nr:hypothetical protein [Acetobacteraceae bacterium]